MKASLQYSAACGASPTAIRWLSRAPGNGMSGSHSHSSSASSSTSTVVRSVATSRAGEGCACSADCDVSRTDAPRSTRTCCSRQSPPKIPGADQARIIRARRRPERRGRRETAAPHTHASGQSARDEARTRARAAPSARSTPARRGDRRAGMLSIKQQLALDPGDDRPLRLRRSSGCVKRNGRSPRAAFESRAMTSRLAPTCGARSILLMTSRSDRVTPGPPLRGILSPPDTSIT